ncbi:MAG: InlB B-repeat-containing protein [Clostridiales bacterium]|nr:InlB B-repeat-containing protein [Clostridiales bacterium]
MLDTDLGQMKVSFYSPAGVFELGSTFFADALSGDEADALKAVIDEEYLEELEGIFMFDVGVKNKFGEKYTELSDKVKLSVSLPDGWENMDIKFIYPTDETDVELTGEIKTLSEGNMYETELEHFGSFALLVYEKPPVPVKKSTLTFDLGGGTLDGKTGKFTIEANAGDVITIPEAPTREGYTFRYWEGSEYYPGDQYTVEDDHTFTAKWEKDEVRTYTVTFDANGHGTAPAAQTVKEGEKAAKPADLSAGGYTFDGWFTDKECKTAFDFNTPITKDTALYAKWTATYKVTFIANGHGTAPAAQTVKEGEKAAKPADLSASGYTFGGWFTDKECKTAFDFNTPITKDTALYAKWTVKSGSEGGNNGASHTSVRKSPETGDENNAGLLFMLMAASLLGMIPIVMRKMGAGN